jgi:hypothetical protein
MNGALSKQPMTMVRILLALVASAAGCGAAPDEGGRQAGGAIDDIATQPDRQPPDEDMNNAPDAGASANCANSASACGDAGAETGTGGSQTPPTAPFKGTQCTRNAPMSGTCSSAGDQCTYVSETETHYCTCLHSAPASPGFQGWSCR